MKVRIQFRRNDPSKSLDSLRAEIEKFKGVKGYINYDASALEILGLSNPSLVMPILTRAGYAITKLSITDVNQTYSN